MKKFEDGDRVRVINKKSKFYGRYFIVHEAPDGFYLIIKGFHLGFSSDELEKTKEKVIFT